MTDPKNAVPPGVVAALLAEVDPYLNIFNVTRVEITPGQIVVEHWAKGSSRHECRRTETIVYRLDYRGKT